VDDTSLSRQHIELSVPSSELTEAKREKRAKSGAALPDGSYPIFDAQSLRSAIRLVGRSKKHSAAEVKAHIIKRAKALGLANLLPEGWS
jgi:hypothetical protein